MADCVICQDPVTGYGNNPAPLYKEGTCCDECNLEYVIPERIKWYYANERI